MSRLPRRFAKLGRESKKAFVSFITAGDPDLAATVPALHALVRGGVDVLELGVPFSDPEADGPVIQAASERALANGVSLSDVLGSVEAFRRDDDETPIVLMGYLNSIVAMGFQAFCERASAAGVDGMIVVNLPHEEAAGLRAHFVAHDIDLIFLVAPSTTPVRIAEITAVASGFIYYVSFKGTTGASHLALDSVQERLDLLKPQTDLPVVVGFGIKDGATAAAVAAIADGIVVGSALVNTMATDVRDTIDARLEAQARDIRAALDQV